MKKIINFFSKYKLSLAGKKIILAISAGPDSMALLDMMRQIVDDPQSQLIICHVDHCLRNDSYLESEIITKYCQQYKLQLEETKWDTPHPANGLEAAARDFRYDFFAKILRKYQADYLFTAHHGDDLAENILIKLLRSGNVQEMNSLRPIRNWIDNSLLVRPLLSFSKEELLVYAKKRKLAYIVDYTNQENETLRNRLRHFVMPQLKKDAVDLIKNANRFVQTEESLEDWQKLLFEKIRYHKLLNGIVQVNAVDLSDFNCHQLSLYFNWLIDKEWGRQVYFESLDLSDNVQNTKDHFTLVRYLSHFYICPSDIILLKNHQQEVVLDQCFSWLKTKYIITLNKLDLPEVGYFYANKTSKFIARNLQANDRLKLPNGSHVKPKKKFAEKKIPTFMRNTYLAILINDDIVFVQDIFKNQEYNINYQRYNIYTLF